jgi:predicted DNA-binding ArsR family transcriptional regulator
MIKAPASRKIIYNDIKKVVLMKKILVSLLTVYLLIGIIACGGPSKALISQSEIDSARKAGTLNRLYDKATGFVSQSKGSSKKEAMVLQSNISQLLVTDSTAKVNQLLARYKADNTSVTRKEIIDIQASISDMQQWSATDYARLNPRLNIAKDSINTNIKMLINQSNSSNKTTVEKVKLLAQAAKMAGEGQAETLNYKKNYDSAISQFSFQGNDALSKQLYSTVIKSAENGLIIDPGNIQFEALLSQGQAGLFERDFRFALENGKPESAYQALIDVADKPIFLQLKKSMKNDILVLANYFSSSAKYAYGKGDLASAYKNFKKGRTIQDKLAISQKGFIQEKRFLDLVMARARNPQSGEGKRQSLMRVVNEFDPNYPGLQSEYLKLSDNVKNRAMTKLSIADFKEVMAADSVVASVGRRIGSKLEKILFEQLGNEVLIVTDLNRSQNAQFQGLALKIDGEVLQAAIERASNQGKRSQNVQTSVTRVETEEYTDWSKRKRGDAPKRYHETPVLEEVILTIEHIRKLAITEVAFRIVEPATGKILLTDSFVKESEFNGESINEYQKGDFHQRYVRADLPSDIKIIDELANELAIMLGEKLATYLQKPEQVFHHKYVEAKAQANMNAAIELLSNALAIAESKGQETTLWYNQLKEMVLK